jgi:starch-binding outer membrane protein, SusD/RagB family
MNRLIRSHLPALALLWLLTACADILDEKLLSNIANANFYQNATDAVAAVNGVYDAIGSGRTGLYWRGLTILAELSTDDQRTSTTNGDFVQVYTGNPIATNGEIAAVWREHYAAIARANSVIARVPATPMNETMRRRVIGEARFIRALLYFNLVGLFDNIPLMREEITSAQGLNVPQAPIAEVYDFIIADLKEAEIGLPLTYTGEDIGRVTQGAARALLAKVYLTNQQWQLAADKCREVVTAAQYRLETDYMNIFVQTNSNNREIVFAIQHKSGLGAPFVGEGNLLGINTWPIAADCRPAGIPFRGNGNHHASDNLVASFEANDLRRSTAIFNQYIVQGRLYTMPWTFRKHIDEVAIATLSASNDSDKDFPVIRYADVLLMQAEALNEVAGGNADALAAVNQVRTRAKIPALTSLAQAPMREAIYRERRSELFMEAHRFFDLKRWGRLIEVVNAAGITGKQLKPQNVRYPIPQRELDVNTSLKQNPGY